MARTVVGITCDIKEKLFESEKYYSEKIFQAGGIPFYLPMTTSDKDVSSVIGNIDAIIISGSRDIDTSLYGQKKTKKINSLNANRTISEILYINKMNRRKKKILGICGGMQLINVCFGGDLLQDIKTLVPDSIEHENGASHTVKIKETSLLKKILEKDKLKVRSYHHQAINSLSLNLIISAESSDKIIEAVESDDQKILGVQWHPELSNSRGDFNIFRWLISKR